MYSRWKFIFIISAIVAAVLGFTGMAGDSSDLAKIYAGGFLICAVIAHFLGKRTVSK